MAAPQPRARARVRILETGNIAFFYRPKEKVLHPTSPNDLERSYFVLFPDDQQNHQNRLFALAHPVFPQIVPREALPEERAWAYVADVSHDPRQVIDALEKNAGTLPEPSRQRVRPYARIAGDGRYAIARHGSHTHLVYELHRPHPPGPVQEVLQIKPHASYFLSIKGPFVPSELVLEEKPSYPDALRTKIEGHNFVAADPTDFLDYRWTQILLIGAQTNVRAWLGIRLQPDIENDAEKQALQLLRAEAKFALTTWHVDILGPLLTGRWE
jgi:hypothetical protein